MAEREGFEPPMELPPCLISSQVHSTGLCHLPGQQVCLSSVSECLSTKLRSHLHGSGFGDELCCAETFHNRYYFYPSPPGLNLTRTDNSIFGIVTAFHDDIGTQSFNQLQRRVLIEDHNRIDYTQGCEHISALTFTHNRTTLAFKTFDRTVAINGDNKTITFPARVLQQTNVTNMQEIKAAICKDNFFAL